MEEGTDKNRKSIYDQIARFYDLTHDQLTADVDYVLALAAGVDGPVLELGCGTGRLLRPLACAGHIVTGIDNSPEMLAIARERLADEPAAVQARVTLVEGDMTQLPPTIDDEFKLAVIPYNTILHVPEGQLGQILRGIWSKLGRNGRLFIDTINPFVLEQIDVEDSFIVEDVLIDPQTHQRIKKSSRTQLDTQQQLLIVTWQYETLADHDQVVDKMMVEVNYHYRFPHQLEISLSAAGFRLTSMLGDYDETAFNSSSDRLLLVASA